LNKPGRGLVRRVSVMARSPRRLKNGARHGANRCSAARYTASSELFNRLTRF
jgi:hypothetical protein